ncbi:MAG: hypothetical protein HQL52_04860 [Magnetococcales bacterium]|nr:hypothetical protein [Magnetococcales bacterium]
MSLVNQMLRDLDQRGGIPSQGEEVCFPSGIAFEEQTMGRAFGVDGALRPWLLGALFAGGLGVAALLMQGVSWEPSHSLGSDSNDQVASAFLATQPSASQSHTHASKDSSQPVIIGSEPAVIPSQAHQMIQERVHSEVPDFQSGKGGIPSTRASLSPPTRELQEQELSTPELSRAIGELLTLATSLPRVGGEGLAVEEASRLGEHSIPREHPESPEFFKATSLKPRAPFLTPPVLDAPYQGSARAVAENNQRLQTTRAQDRGIKTAVVPLEISEALISSALSLFSDERGVVEEGGGVALKYAPKPQWIGDGRQVKQVSQPTDWERSRLLEKEATRTRESDRAIVLLKQAFEADPDNLSAALRLGEKWLLDQQVNQARSLSQTLEHHHPRAVETLLLQVRLAFIDQDSAKAQTLFVQFRQWQIGSYSRYFAHLASRFQKGGMFETAGEIYQALAEQEPRQGNWWLGLAISQERLGFPKEAQDAYLKARADRRMKGAVAEFIEERLAFLAKSPVKRQPVENSPLAG